MADEDDDYFADRAEDSPEAVELRDEAIARYNAEMERRWEASSQAAWCIPCDVCGRSYVLLPERDLDRVIAAKQPDGKLRCPDAICGCILDPRRGSWMHRYPERRLTASGVHYPLPLFAFEIYNATTFGNPADGGIGNPHLVRRACEDGSYHYQTGWGYDPAWDAKRTSGR